MLIAIILSLATGLLSTAVIYPWFWKKAIRVGGLPNSDGSKYMGDAYYMALQQVTYFLIGFFLYLGKYLIFNDSYAARSLSIIGLYIIMVQLRNIDFGYTFYRVRHTKKVTKIKIIIFSVLILCVIYGFSL